MAGEIAGTIVTTIAGVVAGGGLATAAGYLYRWWRDRRADRQADRQDVWQRQAALIDKLDRQLAAVQAEQQRSLAAEMACRAETARLRAMGQWQNALLASMHAALERASLHPDPLPPFPDFREVPATTSAEKDFVNRGLQHQSGLIREEIADAAARPEAAP